MSKYETATGTAWGLYMFLHKILLCLVVTVVQLAFVAEWNQEQRNIWIFESIYNLESALLK